VLAWLIAAAFVVVELAVSGRYGFMQDELYFVEATRHLAFGYVDQPPLTLLLTRVAELPGLSPTAIRIIPALAGGAVVVAAARFAALFGVDQLGRVLATITMACTPSCSAPTTWTTPRRWTCWPGPWCCWVSPRHCCGTGPRWWLGNGGHEPEASVGGCAAEVNGCGAAACGDGNDHGSSLPAPVPLG